MSGRESRRQPDRSVFRLRGTAKRNALLAAVLAVVGVALATGLLAVSGWLIAASGLVGLGLLAMIDIFAPGAVIRAAAIGRTVARYGERLTGHDAMLRQLATLRLQTFLALMRWPVRRLSEAVNGDLLTRLTRDIDVLDLLLPRFWLPSLAAIGGSCLAAFAMLRWAPSMLPIVLALPLLALVSLAVARRRAAPLGRHWVEENARMRADLTNWVDGLAELVMLDRAADRADAVTVRTQDLLSTQRQQRRIEVLSQAVVIALGYLSFWGVLIAGLLLVSEGALAAPIAAGLALLSLGLVETWQAVPGGWVMRANADQAAQRIAALGTSERRTHSTGDRSSNDISCDVAAAPPSSLMQQPQGVSVQVEDLWFSWSDVTPAILCGAALQLLPGERIIVEGSSGCGKSTLGKLLAGELVADRGCVRVDESNWAERREPQRFQFAARLDQNPVLFRDTLEQNLRIARPGAALEELEAALDAVDLLSWSHSLPGGLSTWLGERGVGLSGGQARRLTLARLLLAGRQLLVLDEPLAGLDRATAERVRSGIEPWLAHRTVVVLSHDRFDDSADTRRLRLESGLLVDA